MEDLILVVGNPGDGFRLYGPFESDDDAQEWAEANTSYDWWVMPLRNPTDTLQV